MIDVIDVINGDVFSNQTVIIEGAKIAAVVEIVDNNVYAESGIVDGIGSFLIPGFWDMHDHLIDPDTFGALNVVLPLLITNGIAGIRDLVSSSLDAILAVRD